MDKFEQIKFGDGVGFLVKDRKLMRTLQNQLKHACKLKDNVNKFPGALPVALTRRNIHNLRYPTAPDGSSLHNDADHEIFQLPNGKRRRMISTGVGAAVGPRASSGSIYYVSKKSDGYRYKLMFRRRDGEKYLDPSTGTYIDPPHQTMFDRRMQPIMVKFEVKDAILNGTVLDGEFVKEPDGTHSYYVFDIIESNGRSTIDKNFLDRLILIESVIRFIKPCPNSNESPMTIRVKKFYPVNKLEQFLTDEELWHLAYDCDEPISHLSCSPTATTTTTAAMHPCDGLFLQPIDERVIMGTAFRQFKWKVPKDHTIELLARFAPNMKVLEFFADGEDGKLKLYANQTVLDTLGGTIFEDILVVTGDVAGERSTMSSSYHASQASATYEDIKSILLARFGEIGIMTIAIVSIILDFIYLSTPTPIVVDDDKVDKFKDLPKLEALEGKIIELGYDERTRFWKMKKVRTDKTRPNFIRTIQETVESIRDNITIRDLFLAIGLSCPSRLV